MKVKVAIALLGLSVFCLLMADETATVQPESDGILKQIAVVTRQEIARVLALHRNVQIEDLQRACGLHDTEAQTLQVAAKGAAEQYIRQALPTIEQHFARELPSPDGHSFMVNGKLMTQSGKEPESPFVTVTIHKRPKGMWIARQERNGRGGGTYLSSAVGGEEFGPSDLSRQPLWADTLRQSLSDKQQRNYKEHRTRRYKRALVTAVGAILSVELSLSELQEPVVAAWLRQHVDEFTVNRSLIANVREQLMRLPPDAPDVLSDAQREVLRRLQADPEFDQR